MIDVDTITGPAALASALVNGDTEGLSERELATLDAFTAKLGSWRVVAYDPESFRFTWAYAVYGGDCMGGNVVDYTVHRETVTPCAAQGILAIMRACRDNPRAVDHSRA